MKKFFKYSFISIGVLLLTLLVLPFTLYIPVIQNWAKDLATSYASEQLHMTIAVERIRLKFPLNLVLDNSRIITAEGDTMLYCDNLQLDVNFRHLLQKQIQIERFSFRNTRFHYNDTISQFDLKGNVGLLALNAKPVDLGNERVEIPDIELRNGAVFLGLGESAPDTVKTESNPISWILDIAQLRLENIEFGMVTSPQVSDLQVKVTSALLKKGVVDLGKQSVGVVSTVISGADFSYLNDTATVSSPQPEIAETDTTTSLPWTISVRSLELQNSAGTYGLLHHVPQQGLDPDYIQVSGLNLSVGSFYNRGGEVKLKLLQLSFTERSGLSVLRTQGDFIMNPDKISLTGFKLKTLLSQIDANIDLGGGIVDQNPESPVTVLLSTRIGMQDIYALYPGLQKKITLLPIESLNANTRITGTLGQLDIKQLALTLPGRFHFSGNGIVREAINPDKLNGNFSWQSTLNHSAFLKSMLPNDLQQQIGIPDGITCNGLVKMNGKQIAPNVLLTAGEGKLSVNGQMNLAYESYNINMDAAQFPVNLFLPQDSLGLLTMKITGEGKGFDPLSSKTYTDITVGIDRFDYKRYNYTNLDTELHLKNGNLNGILSSNSDALQLHLDISGNLSPKEYAARITGEIKKIDPGQMGFMEEPLNVSAQLDISGTGNPKGEYTLNTEIRDLKLKTSQINGEFKSVALQGKLLTDEMQVLFETPDIHVSFSSPSGLDEFLKRINETTRIIETQIKRQSIDIETLQKNLPRLELKADIRSNKIINTTLKEYGIQLQYATMSVSTLEDKPFSLSAYVDELSTGGIRLDTISFKARQDSARILYGLHVGNRPGNLDQVASLGFNGYITDNHLRLRCLQRNQQQEQGFRFGCDAYMQDSLVHITFTPTNPILGFSTWTLNEDNYFDYYFDKHMAANVRMENKEQQISLQSATNRHGRPGALNINMKGLDIASLLSSWPLAPPIAGTLSTDLVLDFPKEQINVSGDISIAELLYDKQRVGSIDLNMRYKLNDENRQQVRLGLLVDQKEALAVRGYYQPDSTEAVQLKIQFLSLPLAIANPFLPSDFSRISGALNGEVNLSGKTDAPIASGYLQFANTSISVPMIGTSFGLSDGKIEIVENDIILNNYAINGPNKQPLTINGDLNLRDLSKIMTDITIKGSDFQLINVPKNSKTMLYGKANADLDISAKGPIDGLKLRGNIGLLNGTEVTYVMRDSPLELKQQDNTNMVTFVSFSDSTAMADTLSVTAAKISGMDILMNVDIANEVKMAVNLSVDGKNRIDLKGGGNLTYTMNTLGDSRFTGKYELTGGTVRYNPPLISEKLFNIQQGSYVSWSGNIADPTMNITAVEPLRINVTESNNNSRPVTFNVIINIKNTLENLAITFNVSAPEDLTIQNELTAMTAEQRATQAMNLLIYNSYSGPGTSTSSSLTSGNPLNSFIQKELNQWAQNNLKNIDVSFGIDSYDDTANGGQGTRTDYSYKVSKTLFNDRFKVIIGGSFSPDAAADENLKENLVDDISLEYRLDKRDNMLIKIFRHTGYESILEGEVTQTGVGFVVRKKLLKLSELFRLSSRKAKKEAK